ncbi:DUF3301 domain-containing protein [Dyella sp. A6]|uniref:DUF3301 domain-containing protein n=1 Tax=Dyella aluminiiresistens TaxID=3069105 RepID=UPI002E79846D|nr:DUF3301 domain-containing protein [Dyella sp. A6]
MNGLLELLPLLVLFALVGLWMKLTRARELAVAEARRQCERHGLQLLDETVGLAGVHLRRVRGSYRIERSYAFEVSINGNDRESGRLWMIGEGFSGFRLPTIDHRTASHDGRALPDIAPPSSNVIQLHPRSGNPPDRH